MTITYEFEGSLYINLTNRCCNDCEFCLRNNHDNVNGKDNLWLEREPSVEEIIDSLKSRDLTAYSSVVFCGYGEPLMRFDDCLSVAKWIKDNHPETPLRINTNGQANLIEGKDVTPRLAGLIDSLSISLNASNPKDYDKICRSAFGEKAFDGLLDFATRAKAYVPTVTLSIVDHNLNDGEIEECRKIAEKCGVGFRVREYIE